MPRKIGPEARIIALFNALPEESRRIVLEIIRSQQPITKRPKSQSVPSAGRKSKPKSAEIESTQNTEEETANVLLAARG